MPKGTALVCGAGVLKVMDQKTLFKLTPLGMHVFKGINCTTEPLLVSDCRLSYFTTRWMFVRDACYSCFWVNQVRLINVPVGKFKISIRLWPSGKHCPVPNLVEDDSAHSETTAAAPPDNMDSNVILIKSVADEVIRGVYIVIRSVYIPFQSLPNTSLPFTNL